MFESIAPASYIGHMPKVTGRLSSKIRRSIGRPLPARPRGRAYLVFANEYEEQLFRALAAVHPKGVLINDAGWRLYAHVKLGLFSSAINGARTYRLTHQGVRRAAQERLMKEPRITRLPAFNA